MNNTIPKEMVKEWGLDSLPEAKRIEIVERLGKMMYQAILVRALEILSETDEVELDLLLDEDTTTPETVLKFLSEKIPTFDKLVAEERKKLKQDLLLPTV